MGRARVKLTAAAIDTLLRHEWPGNVRKLHNALERATIVCDDGLIRAQDVSLAPPMVPVMVDSTDLNVVERQRIERAMREVNGNKSRAARQLGIFMIRAAIDGLGLTFSFEEYLAPQIASGALVRVLEDWWPPFASYFLYCPSRRQQPAALSALIDTLRLEDRHIRVR
jgi:DNA-binding transcriptional LysR family regulator